MKNTQIIKNNYKTSTIGRMKEIFGFKTLKEIDNSPEVTEALRKFEVFGNNPRCTQDILFDQISFEISVK